MDHASIIVRCAVKISGSGLAGSLRMCVCDLAHADSCGGSTGIQQGRIMGSMVAAARKRAMMTMGSVGALMKLTGPASAISSSSSSIHSAEVTWVPVPSTIISFL
eukprot:1158972-Pelagomonas_calceolata.AAC.1